MSVRIRKVMDQIPIYRPGGCPEEQGEETAIKLSSNESPWTPPQEVVDAIAQSALTLNRYPDFYKEQLCIEIARHYGVSEDMVSVDNGSGTVLQDLVRIACDQDDEVIFCHPSFAAYDIDVFLAGAVPVHVPLNEAYQYDLDAITAAVTKKTRMIIICNPNNPTGTFVGTSALRAFIAALRPDILVAIDEAYRDFVIEEPYDASQALLNEFPNVALVRTFSKAFGLAGMRIGFCLAQPDVVDAINKTIAEFSVSTCAQAAAITCLSPNVFPKIESRVKTIIEERERFQDRLRAANVPFIPSQSNFIMLPGSIDDRFEACEQAGVIVRPFDNPEGIRITVGTADQMELVAQGLGV